jgi:hypothetical protein
MPHDTFVLSTPALRISALVPAALFALAATVAIPSHAAQRTFVASDGDDANACSRALPCRSFATAAAATDADGEIVVLDSAGYGAVTITQSLSILAPPGVYAGISVFGGDGVTINGAAIRVVLSGLAINGQGGTNGIRIVQAGTVYVDRCVASNLTGAGLRTEASANARLYVADSVFRDNGGTGVIVFSGDASFERIRIENGGAIGLTASSTSGGLVRVDIRDSTIVGNASNGVNLSTGAGSTLHTAVERTTLARNSVGLHVLSVAGTSYVTVDRSLLTGNTTYGVDAEGAGATVILSGNTLTRNGSFAIRQITSSVVESAGNNTSRANGAGNVTGSLGTFSPI